jgi:DNA-binding transcriptional LysR family regulator
LPNQPYWWWADCFTEQPIVRIADAGETLLPFARQLVSMWAEPEAAVKTVVSSQRKMLTVGLLTSVGRDLQRIRSAFTQRRTARQLSLRVVQWGDTSGGLADSSSDVAFLWLPMMDPTGLSFEVLYREPLHVAVWASHPLAARDRVEFSELLDEPFLALPPSAGPARAFWIAEAQRGSRPVRIAEEVSGADETFEAVSSEVGILRSPTSCSPVSTS